MAQDTFIKIRTTKGDREAYQAIASARGVSLSDLIRAHLDRLVKRAGKDEAA